MVMNKTHWALGQLSQTHTTDFIHVLSAVSTGQYGSMVGRTPRLLLVITEAIPDEEISKQWWWEASAEVSMTLL